MRRSLLFTVLAWFFLVIVIYPCSAPADETAKAVERALDFLSREVPTWRPENGCFSCHNNGDAARALYLAKRWGHRIDPAALAETTAFLREPERWENNESEGGEGGQRLAAIQFGAALVEALQAGETPDRAPLPQAARLVAACQEEDGSWVVAAKGALGSPTTYGSPLAAVMSLRVLKAAGQPEFQPHIDKAERWLRMQEPKTVFDSAATLLGLHAAVDDAATAQRGRCLDLIRTAQDASGGWGPYRNSAPEPFDTAVAMLALATVSQDDEIRRVRERGREFLLASQLDDGSWPATTRPAGAVSYAQKMSTTAWAVQAILVSSKTARRAP